MDSEILSPRRYVRDTNWLYRVDTLRTHDHRELELQLSFSLAFLCDAIKALSYAFTF